MGVTAELDARPASSTAPRGDATATSAQGAKPARDALWDNARLVLIVLVVFGHATESIRGTQAVDVPYDIVYAFHVPAFLLISGYFAKAGRPTAATFVGAAQLLVTWGIAEFAGAAVRAVNGDTPFPATFLIEPHWTLWFFVSLFCMRILMPYIAMLPIPLTASLAVALGAGFITAIGLDFSVSRTLALLPFFVLGWTLRRRGLGDADWFRRPSVRLRLAAAGVVAATVAGLCAFIETPAFTTQLVFWRRSYLTEGFDDLEGLGLRAMMLLVGAILALALLVLIPRRSGWWTRLGTNTLAVYVLHVPALEALRALKLDDAIAATPGSVGIMFGLAICLVLACANPPVARLMRFVTEPRWVFRAVPVPR